MTVTTHAFTFKLLILKDDEDENAFPNKGG